MSSTVKMVMISARAPRTSLVQTSKLSMLNDLLNKQWYPLPVLPTVLNCSFGPCLGSLQAVVILGRGNGEVRRVDNVVEVFVYN